MYRGKVQMANDEQQPRVMNARNGPSVRLMILATVAGAVALWLLLWFTYSLDRPEIGAFIGASMNVLLVLPPLLSYYLIMAFTSGRMPLIGQLVCVLFAGGAWMVVQRQLIYPAFGVPPEYGENVTNFIFIGTFGVCTWLAQQSFAYRARLAEAQKLQEQAELGMLEAQLAPHTLFNMTNRVYAVLLDDPQKAAPLFLSMTNMLRHLVERTRKKWVALEEELAFMQDYAAIQRAHDEETTQIQFAVEGDIHVPVPPMLLATLFENAVKHGRSNAGDLWVNVQLTVGDDHLVFQMENSNPNDEPSQPGMGMGLENVERRLELLFPKQYVLTWESRENSFHTHLEIRL